MEADLLLGLPQGRLEQLLSLVAPPARKRDLAGVPAEVRTALREDEARAIGPTMHRNQDRGLGAAVGLQLQRVGGREQETAEIRLRHQTGCCSASPAQHPLI